MSKKTIEVNDNLDEIVNEVKEEILSHFVGWLDNTLINNALPCEIETLDWDDWYNGSSYGCDVINEAADSGTPIYNSDINDLWYLHADLFLKAFREQGFEIPKEAYRFQQTAIWCYLSQEVWEFANELQEKLDEWKQEDGITKEKLIENFKNSTTKHEG